MIGNVMTFETQLIIGVAMIVAAIVYAVWSRSQTAAAAVPRPAPPPTLVPALRPVQATPYPLAPSVAPVPVVVTPPPPDDAVVVLAALDRLEQSGRADALRTTHGAAASRRMQEYMLETYGMAPAPAAAPAPAPVPPPVFAPAPAPAPIPVTVNLVPPAPAPVASAPPRP